MVEDKIDVEKMVGTYIKLRTAIEEKKEQRWYGTSRYMWRAKHR